MPSTSSTSVITINEDLAQIKSIWHSAKCLYDENSVERSIVQVANKIADDYSSKTPLLIGLMKGAMVFMGRLLTRLPLPLHTDFCHATRYQGEVKGGDIVWKHYPSLPVKDRHILFVDDIFDEGKTLAGCVAWARAQGAASVESVVLVDKQHDRKTSGHRPQYVGLQVPDEFVVGYGMDYKDYFRNVNGVFSIDPRT